MQKALFPVLALVSLVLTSPAAFAQYADSVVSYTPGVGVAAGYMNPSVALGEPFRSAPGNLASSATPFSPAWQTNQIVSIGAGGSLILQFNSAIRNDPGHPYGIDFIVFGNSGFTITNGNYSGGGITDGSLFAHNTGATRVSVSADGIDFYVLDPALAEVVDSFYPTDSLGSFFTPVNPILRDFGGKNLAGIQEIYAGSGGGTGFDLAWARDTNGQNIPLETANFVRIDVLSGKSDVDAVAALPTQTTYEDFSSAPLGRGWRLFGNTNLFHWSSAEQYLEVAWDSAQPNSYFQYPLGTILNRHDDFSIGFDLLLNDIAAGTTPDKPSTFPLAIGLQNNADATGTNFRRTTGLDSPNLVEFNFFPDTGFGPTVWPAIWATNSTLTYRGSSDFTIMDLPVGVTMRITMNYSATNSTLVNTIMTNGVLVGPVNAVTLSTNFTDFRVDTFAITSYAETQTGEEFGGSLLAHGKVDNVSITLPPPAIQMFRGEFMNGQWQGSFFSRTDWSYAVEATEDFKVWTQISEWTNGTGRLLWLQDTNSAARRLRFYRIKSQRSSQP